MAFFDLIGINAINFFTKIILIVLPSGISEIRLGIKHFFILLAEMLPFMEIKVNGETQKYNWLLKNGFIYSTCLLYKTC